MPSLSRRPSALTFPHRGRNTAADFYSTIDISNSNLSHVPGAVNRAVDDLVTMSNPVATATGQLADPADTAQANTNEGSVA